MTACSCRLACNPHSSWQTYQVHQHTAQQIERRPRQADLPFVRRTQVYPALHQVSKASMHFAECVLVAQLMLSLPTFLPLTAGQFQFPLTVALVGSVAAWYMPQVGARHWYIDPKRQAAAAKPALVR